MAKTKTILFVCTGNTCRSPMAEALAKDYLAKNGTNPTQDKNIDAAQDKDQEVVSLRILSAGLSTYPDMPPSPPAQTVMSELGLDISQHRCRLLTEELLREADLVLTMTTSHKYYVEEMLKFINQEDEETEVAPQVSLLKEYALDDKAQKQENNTQENNTQEINNTLGNNKQDILDPFGQSVEAYRACAQELSHYIQLALAKFMASLSNKN